MAILAILWPSMGLITILGEDNFTNKFYVKRDGDSRESSLIEHTLDKMAIFGHIMANLAKYGFNYNFGRG